MTYIIEWSDDMSVGNDLLDKDHKILIKALNDFIQAIEDDEGVFVIDGIFTGLLNYTDFHFKREEKAMRIAGFPGLESHQGVHADLVEKVIDVRRRFMQCPTATLETEVSDFLKSWLQDHILVQDMAYKPLMQSLDQDELNARISEA
ncbi:MAG: hemerythrin family protein [Alphaproteobacteria bacterium]|nr:hemerythrin family protein [Alphaproteobacteria bacterium]